MEVFEKVKFYREQKGFSQDSVAYALGMQQSQYSRRENGRAKFSADEIFKISKVLEIEISELFDDKTIIFNSNNQSGGNFGQYINQSEKLIEQYESRLKEKDEQINLLKSVIDKLRK